MPFVCYNYFFFVFPFPFLLLIHIFRNVDSYIYITKLQFLTPSSNKVVWDIINHHQLWWCQFIFLNLITILLQF